MLALRRVFLFFLLSFEVRKYIKGNIQDIE
jgi:hypothetical protein